MAITPSSLNFSYKKGDALPPARVVNYSAPDFGNNFISSEASESWLHASNYSFTSANIYINSNANNLTVGTHSATIEFFNNEEDFKEPNQSGPPTFIKTSLGVVTVSIVITEAVILTLSPDNLTFNYEFGGTTPSAQTVNVTSENSWTITENTNWLSISTTTGSNNGTFQVSVTPSGLNAGTHTTNVTVNDGVTTKTLSVSLIVSEPDTGTDYLYVAPNYLNFGYTISGIIPPFKRVELNSSGNWSATTNKSWIKLVTSSGTSGVGVLEIGLQNLSGLTIGSYNGIVTITVGSIVKTVNVNLSVYAFAQELLQSFTNYFTEEDNIIEVSSGRYDTHLSISVSSTFEGIIYDVPYAIPFYQGSAKKRIGLEAKKIIGMRPFVGLSNASVFIPYKPVLLNISIKEKELFSETVTQEIQLENIRFIKGYKPTNDWISDLPRKVYLTTKGILLFSFLSNYKTANSLEISGAINKKYNVSNEYNEFYSAILPLENENLKVGDIINVTALSTSIQIQIKPDGVDHSFVFWENQWGCWDAFEFTGEFTESSNIKQTSFSFRKNHNQKETKVLDITDKRMYKVNTGWIYTDNEVQTLQKMLLSKNIYLMKNNRLVKVKSSNKGLVISKTNKFLKSFDLKFENVVV